MSEHVHAAIDQPVFIAIPARDERDRLPACLRALAAQATLLDGIVVLLDNCRDDSAAMLARLRPSLPVPLHVVETRLPGEQAHAGTARRLAMRHASRLAAGNGVLMTTDADTVAAPNWVAANLAAISAGADLVAGRAVIDPIEALAVPARLHADDARECRYAELLDALHDAFDPDPHDPWPRHAEHSGASLAVRTAMHDRVGGIPAFPLGEDRAFVAALREIDARIRHAPEVWVTVSGRLLGRAAGGMADTMRRRMQSPDPYLDDRLEPAHIAARRARLRAAFRRAWRSRAADASLTGTLALPDSVLAEALARPFFGEGWTLVEDASPALRRHLVRAEDLGRETEIAQALLENPVADLTGSVPPFKQIQPI